MECKMFWCEPIRIDSLEIEGNNTEIDKIKEGTNLRYPQGEKKADHCVGRDIKDCTIHHFYSMQTAPQKNWLGV